MEWQFIVVLAVVIPIIIFGAVFAWYLNARSAHAVVKEVIKEARMDAAELKNLKIAKQVDARGVAYPGLLAARRAMASVPEGGVLEVLSPDEETNQNVPLWCKKVGYRHLGTIDGPGYWRIFIEKSKS